MRRRIKSTYNADFARLIRGPMASPMERRSSIPALGYTARPADYEKYGPVHRDF